MDANDIKTCVPIPNNKDIMKTMPLLNFASGYLQRSSDLMPRMGLESPWRLNQNYMQDCMEFYYSDVEDGVMRYNLYSDSKQEQECKLDCDGNHLDSHHNQLRLQADQRARNRKSTNQLFQSEGGSSKNNSNNNNDNNDNNNNNNNSDGVGNDIIKKRVLLTSSLPTLSLKRRLCIRLCEWSRSSMRAMASIVHAIKTAVIGGGGEGEQSK
jgi:hypothetical protein